MSKAEPAEAREGWAAEITKMREEGMAVRTAEQMQSPFSSSGL